MLLARRLQDDKETGKSTAFDNFFLGVVLLVIATGCLAEMGRYWFPAGIAVAVYIVHLGATLCLFLTFPYSKFAHLAYRSLAMVHERMTPPAKISAE